MGASPVRRGDDVNPSAFTMVTGVLTAAVVVAVIAVWLDASSRPRTPPSLAPARGCLIGLAFSVVIWAVGAWLALR